MGKKSGMVSDEVYDNFSWKWSQATLSSENLQRELKTATEIIKAYRDQPSDDGYKMPGQCLADRAVASFLAQDNSKVCYANSNL